MNRYAVLAVGDSPYSISELPADDRVERARAGDERAFVELYREHYAEVRALAERILGCPMTAEDVVHDVFLALPDALSRFRGDGTLRNYVLSIVVRASRRHVRTARRRRALEEQLARETDGAATATRPDCDAESRELARLLRSALDALSEDQRVAFVLCEVEERTSVEAAEILGENDSTVRARVFHAKKKLRARLEKVRSERGKIR